MSDPQPTGWPARAHRLQAFAGPPAMLTDPFLQPIQAVFPDQLFGRPARAHEFQSFAAPPRAAIPTALQPLQPVLPTPINLRGRPRCAHEYQAFASPGRFVTPVAPAISGFGAVGAATFVLGLESGARITFSWATDVIATYGGQEQRQSAFGSPRRRIEGNAFVLDAADRDVKGALVRAAAQGSTFLLAIPMEEVSIAADSPGSVLNVTTTVGHDWALPGQRIVIAGTDGSTTRAIVQSTTSTTIAIVIASAGWNFAFGALGAAGRAGGRAMPVVQVLLDPDQGFARYPTAIDLWSLRAIASVFGWAGVDSMGTGTAITSYTAVDPVPVAALTDDDLLIWDRVNAIDGTASESMLGHTEIVDLGALPFSIGGAAVPNWQRSIRMRSTSRDDWQWLKAFVRRLRGRQGAFLLPTNRPDLVPVGIVSGGVTVQSPTVIGAGDYTSWFVSLAHRKLAIATTDGAVQYAGVTDTHDNGDGTITLTLDSGVFGTLAKISFLELVRLTSDDVEVSWDGAVFTCDLGAVSVQDSTPYFPVFDTVVDVVSTLPNNQEFLVAMGTTTLIQWTSDRTLTFIGLGAIGGNVDGSVACIVNMNTTPLGLQLDHESGSATPANRFHNVGLTGITGTGIAVWYRYNATLARWIELMRT